MASISVELKSPTSTSSSTSAGKFEVNANVETPTSGTPGTYRQLQGNIRGDSPSSTSTRKPIYEMEVSGDVQLSGDGGDKEERAKVEDGVGSGGGGGLQQSDPPKQLKHDQKVSSSEDEELSLEGRGAKAGKSGEKKKRRLHLSFPRFGGKGKKTRHDVVATDSTGSDDIPEKKVKVEEPEEGDKVDKMEGEVAQIEIKGEASCSSEQPEWNVDTSGCGDADSRANMAATGQGSEGELDNGSTAAGARVSTGFAVSGDAGFNEHGEEADSTREELGEESGGGEGVDVNIDIGGTSGIGNHTTAPPFLDADKSKEVPGSFVTEDQNGNDMNAIEVKLAGMHSNIGFMEADLAECDLRASLIFEEPSSPDLEANVDEEEVVADSNAPHADDLELYKTVDKERVVADSNVLLTGDDDVGVDVDVDADVAVDVDVIADDTNSTSALLAEIAQTIHAIEEAGGTDGSGGDMNFSLELDNDDEEDLYVPKLDLGDMSEDSDTIPEEDEDIADNDGEVDVDGKGEIDFSGASTKSLDGSHVGAPNGEAGFDGSLKADVDLDIEASGEKDLPDCRTRLSASLNKRGDDDDTKVVTPDGEAGIGDVQVKGPSGSVKVDFDKSKTGQIDDKIKTAVPSGNVDAKTSGNIDRNVGDKKKKSTKSGGFRFHFPRFGGKKPTTSKQTDVSLDTDDLIGDVQSQNGPQVTMVAGVKDGGNTATLHVVTERPTLTAGLKRSASLEMKAPKKPPRDPSVDSSDLSGLELDADVCLPKHTLDFNRDVHPRGDIGDVDGIGEDPSIQVEGELDIDVKMTKPDLEVDLQDPKMIDIQQDADIKMSKPEVGADIPDASVKVELQHDDADINLPQVNGGAIVADSPGVESRLQFETNVNIPQANGKLEAQGPSGAIDAKGIADPSGELLIAPKPRNTKVDDKKLKLGTKDIDNDLEIKIKDKRKAKQERKAKHKRKALTLPSLHFKSNREKASQDAARRMNGRVEADGRANGEAGVAVVKVDVPDVSAGVHVDGNATRTLGDGRSSSDGSIDINGEAAVGVDIGLKGSAECNSLPQNSLPNATAPEDVQVQRKDKGGKKRNFNFPSIHFSFPKFGGNKQKPKSPEMDLNVKGDVSLDADVKGDDLSLGGDVKGQMPSVNAPDVQVEAVEEVEIKAEVKNPDVDFSGKLAGLGGLGGEVDTDFELNGNNTTDEMKLNLTSNLPDICNHGKGDPKLPGGVDVNGEVNVEGEVGVEGHGGVEIPCNTVGEIDIKPVSVSVNFAAAPTSAKDEPSHTDIFSTITDIGDMTFDDDVEASEPTVDIDVDYDPSVLQQVHESDVCVHAAVDVDPSFDLDDKLAGLHLDYPDVHAQPLEVNIAMDAQNSPNLDIKEPTVDVTVKGEVQIEDSLPDVKLDTKSSPHVTVNEDMSTGKPNGMAKTNTPGISPSTRRGLTLDVKHPDSPDLSASGSVDIPSSAQSASEVSFEMSTKGSKKNKKKLKKKKKSKKDGKKKDGHLNMSIDLEPDATSTPIKSRDQNGRHMIPLTPESGNASLDGAIAVHSNLSSPTYTEPQRRPHSVVIAIDFGTTFSGYAYSFSRDPFNIQVMRKWEGGDPGVMNMKTPTTLLLSPDGEFHSFGFSARDFYHDMDHAEALNWLYFDKFKLTLHNNPELCMTTEIAAANGKTLPAIKVFEHALRFFREHAIEELCDQSTDGTFDPDEIRWVLTVPAIWKQPAKQFMRQAAYLAGIASHACPEQLLIALEPEAASICIRELRMRELQPEKISQRHKWVRTSMQKAGMDVKVAESIRNGTRYMVVDCGGGTVDITVHEVEDQGGTLKELHKATGGACGSVNIDIAFERLLVDIFGQEYIDEYKIKRPAGWVDLMIAFEARKRNASPWKNNPLNVSLPFSFIDYYKKYTNGLSTVEDEVVRYDNKDVSWSAQGMLRFTPEGMKELFKPTIAEIIKHVEDILNQDDLGGVSYLFLAGGFAQSPLLQSEMRKKFNSRLRVVIPCDVGITILRGAVMFGLDPTAIRVRRSRLTYGVGVLNKFNAQKHPKDKYVMKDNREWCKDVFETFVKVDEAVAIGDKVVRCYTPARPNQKKLVINIYSSTNPQVLFVTEEQVTKCGTLKIDVTDSDVPRQRRKLHVSMQYGETEIKVSAVDETTGKCVHAVIDFLNK